jgi:DNA polymerase-3 subunit delta'
VTPPVAAVADVLVRRDGVEPEMAIFAARAAQSHVGRARRLATDQASRDRRTHVLAIASRLNGVGDCLTAAADLVAAAGEEADVATGGRDAEETAGLALALGQGSSRGLDSSGRAQLKDLEKQQKRRATRTARDILDLALLDLVGLYRDVLAVQLGSGVEPANPDLTADIRALADAGTPEATLRRIESILECRTLLAGNVSPLLAVEAMVLSLRAA